MRRRRLAWSATETVGIGITNPRPVVKFPVTPEMREKWEQEAKGQGISLDDYLETLFQKAPEDP
jgi:hypothetical protein